MTQIAAELVRAARRSSGLTQRALAARARISGSAVADVERSAHDPGSESLERLLRAAGHRLCILPTTSSPVSAWADFIYRELRSTRRSQKVAFRSLIGLSDELAAASKPLRVALCIAVPAPCGDERYDAALAGLVDYHLGKDRLPIPDWVRQPDRILAEPWKVSPYTDWNEVPRALARHGVWLAETDLASV
jgi:transcriptional regulator with XRE-family HTH domain